MWPFATDVVTYRGLSVCWAHELAVKKRLARPPPQNEMNFHLKWCVLVNSEQSFGPCPRQYILLHWCGKHFMLEILIHDKIWEYVIIIIVSCSKFRVDSYSPQ